MATCPLNVPAATNVIYVTGLLKQKIYLYFIPECTVKRTVNPRRKTAMTINQILQPLCLKFQYQVGGFCDWPTISIS